MTTAEYWKKNPLAAMDINFHDGKSIGEMTTEEILDVFHDAVWNDLKTTKAFILVFASLEPDLYKAIQKKYPEHLL